VVPNQFNSKARLLVLMHLINVNTLSFCINRVVSLASLKLTFCKSMNSKSMVVRLPDQTSEFIHLALNINWLVGNLVIIWIAQVKKLNAVLLWLLRPVAIYYSQIITLRMQDHLKTFRSFHSLLWHNFTLWYFQESNFGIDLSFCLLSLSEGSKYN
jgi:hypothetical protein